jgi:hemoglobin-like flavoprotein
MSEKRFRRNLLLLEILSLFQKGVRVTVRAAWLGLGTFLVAWSANALFGWLPDPKHWGWFSFAIFVLSLTGIILPWPRRKRFTWKLDRRLGGNEQISTAWEVIVKGDIGKVSQALVDDALDLLAGYRKQILLKGWWLLPDLISTAIVVILLVVVFTTRPVTYEITREAGNLPLQPIADEPSLRDVFPSGSPGLQKLADFSGQNDVNHGVSQVKETGEAEISPEDYQKVTEALLEMGNELSKNAATYDVGEALIHLEMEQAASAMDALASSAAQLSSETRTDLAQSIQEAAEKLEDLSSLDILPHMQDAAQALVNEDGSDQSASIQNGLENLASDLREVNDLLNSRLNSSLAESGGDRSESASSGPGQGAGLSASSDRGNPEPIFRLFGEGQTIDLESLSENMRTALRPVNPTGELQTSPSSGPRSSVFTESSIVIEADLVPYRFPWKWRDVVSKYFSP